jgi:competence protein ComEC
MSWPFITLPLPPSFHYSFFLIAGIISQAAGINESAILLAAFCISIITVCAETLWKKKAVTSVLNLLFFFTGAFRYNHQIVQHSCATQSIAFKKVSLEGKVTQKKECLASPYPVMIQLNILKIRDLLSNRDQDCAGNALNIYCKEQVLIEIGDRVTINELLLMPSFSLHQKQRFLIQGVIAESYNKQLTYAVIHRPNISIMRWFNQHRKRLCSGIKTNMSPVTYNLFSSLFLGLKDDRSITETVEAIFKRWGVVHYLARSGLHVQLAISLWRRLLGFIPIPFVLKHILLLTVLFFYSLLSWSGIAFMRALIMYFLFAASALRSIPFCSLHGLSVSCTTLLLYNPIYLFRLEFQLTFLVTAIILLVNKLGHHRLSIQSRDSCL